MRRGGGTTDDTLGHNMIELVCPNCTYVLINMFSRNQAEEDFRAMKLSDLKQECERLGLKKSGTKAELIARILENNKIRVTHAHTAHAHV